MTREILKHKWWTSYINSPYFYLPNYNSGGSDFSQLSTGVRAYFNYGSLMGGSHRIITAYCDGNEIIYLYTYAKQEDKYYDNKLLATVYRNGGYSSSSRIDDSVYYHDTTPHKGYIIFLFEHNGQRSRYDTDPNYEISKIDPAITARYYNKFISLKYPIEIESTMSRIMRYYWKVWINLETMEIRQCATHYHNSLGGESVNITLPNSGEDIPAWGTTNFIDIARGVYDTDEYSSRVGYLKI